MQRLDRVATRLVEWVLPSLLLIAPLWVFPGGFDPGIAKLSFILICMLALLAIVAVRSWINRQIVLRIPWSFIGAMPLIACALLSASGATNPLFVGASLTVMGIGLAFGLLVSQFATTERFIQRMLFFVLAAGAMASLIAIVQYTGWIGDPVLSPLDRTVSVFGNRNYLGSFLGVIAIPSLALVLSSRRRSVRMVAGGASALCFFGSLLVQQMGILLALPVGIAFVIAGALIFGLRDSLRVYRMRLAALALVVLLGAGMGALVWWINPEEPVIVSPQAPLASLWTSNSGVARDVDWGTALEMFKAHPLAGVGLGNYKVDFLEYKSIFLSKADAERFGAHIKRAFAAHNDYLQLMAELGGLGAMAAIAWIAMVVAASWMRCRRILPPRRRLEFLLLMAGVVVALVHAVVSFPFHLPSTALTVIALLGLTSSSYFGDRATTSFRLSGTWARVMSAAGILALCLVGMLVARQFAAHILHVEGVAFMRDGQLVEAQQSFQRSIEISDWSAETKFLLASVALLRSDQTALPDYGDTEDALVELAWSYALRSQLEYPTEQNLLLGAGIALLLDETAQAQDMLDRILASRPWSVFEKDARYLLATLDAKQGNTMAAQTACQELIREFPTYIQSYILLGKLLRQSGRLDEATSILSQGVQTAVAELARIDHVALFADRRTQQSLQSDRQRVLTELQTIVGLLENPSPQ